MADNLPVNNDDTTLVATLAADDIGGVMHPRCKVEFGVDGSAVDVSASNPLPVVQAGVATEAKQDAGNASLSSIDGKTPAIGQANKAGSTPVVLASDSDRIGTNPITGQSGVSGGAGAVEATTQRLTLASDDPAVAALGSTSDTAAAVGGTGSVNAKLRRVTTQLDSIDSRVDGVESALAGLAVESGGNLAAIAASASAIDDWDESDRAKVNPVVGQAGIAAGSGAVSANTTRAILATDDPAVTALQVMDDWDESDRVKANIIAGQAGITAGAGAVAANTPRITHASDDPTVVSLALLDDVVFTDDVAFTPATSKVAAVGMQADETATDSVDEGDIGCPRITLDRKQIVASYAHTTGGWTPTKLVSGASTNATSVKGSAGQVGFIFAGNTNAAARYLKLYNKASSPTVGTDVPVLTFMIPGNTAGSGFSLNIPAGVKFDTGIALALTTGAADNDTGAVAAGEITVNIGYA